IFGGFMRIGFIGLGRMGQGMASRLLGGGHELLVFNRTTEKTADLAKAGATVAANIAEVCKDRDFVISMMADDTALEAVTLGPAGVREVLPRSAIYVSMGKHSAGTTQAIDAALKGHGQTFVEATVIGRPDA